MTGRRNFIFGNDIGGIQADYVLAQRIGFLRRSVNTNGLQIKEGNEPGTSSHRPLARGLQAASVSERA